jgi:radical SAM superfamily enzyme YgiQ (UPF0313 family)
MSPQKDEKLDVLFVHVPKFSSYYKPLDEFMFINYLPMGVFALCDRLNKHGIASKIKHLGLEHIQDANFSIVNYVCEQQIPVVAMSLHWHFQSYDVIEVARKIKAASPATAIILGGFTASRFAQEILTDYDCVDYIIAGDGERGLLELVQALQAGQKDLSGVSNCVHRKDGNIVNNGITYVAGPGDLAGLEFANLELLDHAEAYRDYFKVPLFWQLNISIQENMRRKISGATTTFPLMIGRGCNVNCSFCGGGREAQIKMCGRAKAVFMPISKVVDTMEHVLAHGYESFIVSFDPTPRQDDYYLDLFAEVRRRKISCGMGFESWGLPTTRFIEAFGQTFVKDKSYLAFSPETGSEELRKLNKGFFYTNDELYRAMQLSEDARIPMMIYLTIGLPGETSEQINGNVEFSQNLRKRFKSVLDILTIPVQLEPGSPLFEHPEHYHAITERRCFRDFYDYHQQPDSNPYSYLGYATKTLHEVEGDIQKFHEFILKERCQKFCIIQFKLFGKFHIPAVSRLICALSHKRWTRMGFGSVPVARRTFQ